MEIGDQMGVALLAVLGALIARRFQIPGRIVPLVPMALSIVIVWVWLFDRLESVWQVLGNGTVSGLLAGGMLYILMGVKSGGSGTDRRAG